MNDNANAWEFSDEMFDRLVDDELAPEERRALLAALDDHPANWRRCALAFLEAQSWRSELGDVQECIDNSTAAAVVENVRGGKSFSWPVLLAMAASFLAAFVLGWGASDLPSFVGGYSSKVVNAPKGGGGLQPPNVAQTIDGNVAQPPRIGAGELLDERLPQYLTLAIGAGPDAQIVDLPVYELDEASLERIAEQAEPLPADLLQTLHRSGHEVHRQQRLMPISLQDGGRVVVPVERIQITPVGINAYQ